MIRDHITANLAIEPDDFECAPFARDGGLGKVFRLFGEQLNAVVDELTETLVT